MNKTFTKNETIELSSNWHLSPDSDNGVVLTYSQIRERKNKKTEEIEEFLYTEPYYYPRVVSALKHFVDKTQNESKTLEELIAKVDYNTELLKRLDFEFRQFD